MKGKSLSHVRLLAIPWTAAYQAPPSMGFSRQEYWSGVPLPSLLGNRRTYNGALFHPDILTLTETSLIMYGFMPPGSRYSCHWVDSMLSERSCCSTMLSWHHLSNWLYLCSFATSTSAHRQDKGHTLLLLVFKSVSVWEASRTSWSGNQP